MPGLALLHVEEPELDGSRRLVKAVFDRVVGLGLLLLALPVLVACAAAVRATSAGPAIFRQDRVGKEGETFRIWKLRTMYVDAEVRLADLTAHNVHGHDAVLFKIHDDPRITRVGAFLRRYSLDELPQLVNVVLGHMSLVGPRPPLRQEVDRYNGHVHRRLLVKPGMTALWQVSGRSDHSLGGLGAPRPALRRELVPRPRRGDHLQDGPRHPSAVRGVLTLILNC